jgi:hypothetical protein
MTSLGNTVSHGGKPREAKKRHKEMVFMRWDAKC